MTQFSLRARWVLPVSSPPIASGVVTIEDERIVSVGQTAVGDIHDLGDVVLLPGLVNAHTHLEFSDCEKPLGHPGMPLPEWIRQVIGTRHRNDRDALGAVKIGSEESLRACVTTIGEISTMPSSAYAELHGSNLVAFQEVIGFSAARCDSVQNDLEQRLNSGASDSRISLGISPHAPYTVHPSLLRNLVSSACERNLPVAMHLAESREELDFLSGGTGPFQQLLADRSMWDPNAIPPGSKPLDYLQVLSEAPRALIIHGNYLCDEEFQFLAVHRAQMSVVYCPRTHAFFAHDAYPLEKMLQAGVRVALGTDSRASNPNLSLLEEMRHVARQFRELSGDTILQMGTVAGAEALGLSHETGTIAAGKLADLIAIPCSARDNPLEILRSTAQPSHVVVRGKLIKLAH